MSFNDVFMLLVGWIHGMSAVVWVGGSLFYVLVLRPRHGTESSASHWNPVVLDQFRSVVGTCIMLLVITGTIMLFDRITTYSIPHIYIYVVTLKIILALLMFLTARGMYRRFRHRLQPVDAPSKRLFGIMGLMFGVNRIVILGVVIFLVSEVLSFIYVQGLTGL